MYIHVTTLVLCASTVLRITEACSSRSTPKPRTPSPATRPNITFPTYACPPAYATWYCLNGATCFTVEISESILYNCVCADGYTGPRCEFKDLDGSYLPSRERVMVEKASIASGVTVAVVLIVVISIAFYIYRRRQKTKKKLSTSNGAAIQVTKQPSFSRSQRQSDERCSTRLYNQPDVEAGRGGNVRRDLSSFHSQGSSSPPRDIVVVSRGSNP